VIVARVIEVERTRGRWRTGEAEAEADEGEADEGEADEGEADEGELLGLWEDGEGRRVLHGGLSVGAKDADDARGEAESRMVTRPLT